MTNDQALSHHSQAERSTSLPNAWVEKIFAVLTGYYGKHIADLWADADTRVVKALWGEKLGNMKPEEIKRGLDSCVNRKFPPTLPEFIQLCKGTAEHVGLKSAALAYREATQASHKPHLHEWSHPAVYHAAKRVGFFELSTMTERESFRLFEDAYKQTVLSVLNGEQLPEIPKRLEKLERVEITEEDRKAGLEVLGSLKGIFNKPEREGDFVQRHTDRTWAEGLE